LNVHSEISGSRALPNPLLLPPHKITSFPQSPV
jgi:hypothetical protein